VGGGDRTGCQTPDSLAVKQRRKRAGGRQPPSAVRVCLAFAAARFPSCAVSRLPGVADAATVAHPRRRPQICRPPGQRPDTDTDEQSMPCVFNGAGSSRAGAPRGVSPLRFQSTLSGYSLSRHRVISRLCVPRGNASMGPSSAEAGIDGRPAGAITEVCGLCFVACAAEGGSGPNVAASSTEWRKTLPSLHNKPGNRRREPNGNRALRLMATCRRGVSTLHGGEYRG
jgi:hypothetical protein